MTQCHVCGWSRGHDYGCPNDPLNPGAASVASPVAKALSHEEIAAAGLGLEYVHSVLRWAACGYVHTPERIANLHTSYRIVDKLVNAAPASPSVAQAEPLTDAMVDRFLSWKLPPDFSPDGGIAFKRVYNESSPFGPRIHEPTGTNLLTADQARAMLEHVVATLPSTPKAEGEGKQVPVGECTRRGHPQECEADPKVGCVRWRLAK